VSLRLYVCVGKHTGSIMWRVHVRVLAGSDNYVWYIISMSFWLESDLRLNEVTLTNIKK